MKKLIPIISILLVIQFENITCQDISSNQFFCSFFLNECVFYFLYLFLKVNYNYCGCFKDCGSGSTCVRDLNSLSKSSSSMTVEYCYRFCLGFKYFGVEYS